MKTNLTNAKNRKFFQLEIDQSFKKRLQALANKDGITASGVIRQLVNREYESRFNGNGSQPCPDEDKNDQA
jgi:hypothetical protein